MKATVVLFILILPRILIAHPGGGLIAINADTVIFGDPANNVLWRLEKDKKPEALVKNFHVHWTTLGLDGRIYAESFQEIGGAAFRIDLEGGKLFKVAEESDLEAPVFAVGKKGEIVFQKGTEIVQKAANSTIIRFRGGGGVAAGEPSMQQVLTYYWASDGALFLSDGNHLRRVGSEGVVRLVASIDGKPIEPKIWNSTGAPRIWSIAADERKRVYTALPDIGQVVRIDPDGSQHIINRSSGGWRATAVATFGDSVFLLESSDTTNTGQRVRVIRGSRSAELLGRVDH